MQVIKLLSILMMLLIQVSLASEEIYEFDNANQREQYQQLSKELRCVVCQNQNLADSNAELASDLKDIIADMTMQGKSHDAIIDFMVSRYGEYVLYKPPFNTQTLLLWLGPFLLLILVFIIIWRWQQNNKQQSQLYLDKEALNQAHELLSGDNDNDKNN